MNPNARRQTRRHAQNPGTVDTRDTLSPGVRRGIPAHKPSREWGGAGDTWLREGRGMGCVCVCEVMQARSQDGAKKGAPQGLE